MKLEISQNRLISILFSAALLICLIGVVLAQYWLCAVGVFVAWPGLLMIYRQNGDI